MRKCYCCSGLAYKNCCQPYISGRSSAPTAQALMRSRFSAFALKKANYLKKTVKMPAAKNFADLDLQDDDRCWYKLEIISSVAGKLSDDIGEVSFKAYYKLDPATDFDRIKCLSERSLFKKIAGRWYYVDKLG